MYVSVADESRWKSWGYGPWQCSLSSSRRSAIGGGHQIVSWKSAITQRGTGPAQSFSKRFNLTGLYKGMNISKTERQPQRFRTNSNTERERDQADRPDHYGHRSLVRSERLSPSTNILYSHISGRLFTVPADIAFQVTYGAQCRFVPWTPRQWTMFSYRLAG